MQTKLHKRAPKRNSQRIMSLSMCLCDKDVEQFWDKKLPHPLSYLTKCFQLSSILIEQGYKVKVFAKQDEEGKKKHIPNANMGENERENKTSSLVHAIMKNNNKR